MFCNMSVSCFGDFGDQYPFLYEQVLSSLKCHNKVCFKNQPIIDHLKNKQSQSNQDSAIEIIRSWSSSRWVHDLLMTKLRK